MILLENIKQTKNYKLIGHCFLTSLALLLVLILIIAIKGIFPFGPGTLSYFDMSQGAVPYYYHFWDILHGQDSFFINWTENLGTPGSVSFELPDLWFLFAIIPRNQVLNSVTYIVFSRIIFAGICMSFVLYKILQGKWHFLQFTLSLCYALSGSFILYYVIPTWLDFGMLLPLFLYSLWLLATKNSCWLYIIILICFLLRDLYFTLMMLMQVFFVYGIVLYFFKEKLQASLMTFKLFVCSLFAGVLTLFHTLGVLQTIIFSGRSGIADGLAHTNVNAIQLCYNKLFLPWLSLANSTERTFWDKVEIYYAVVPFVILALFMVFKYLLQDNKCLSKCFICIFVFICIPLFVEWSNLLLHFGSYQWFPVRFSCFLNCEVIILLAYIFKVINEHKTEISNTKINFINEKHKSLNFLFTVLLILYIVCFAYGCYNNYQSGGILSRVNSWSIVNVKAIFIEWCIVILCCRFFLYDVNRLVKLLSVITISTACLFAAASLGVKENDSYGFEQKSDYLYELNNIQEQWLYDFDALKRIKNVDISYNQNYSEILHVPALSGWVHTNKKSYQDLFRYLGYSAVYTAIQDHGGTLFSDAVLGVKTTISKEVLPQELYQYQQSIGQANFCKAKYTLPIGVVLDKNVENTLFLAKDVAKNQNRLYHTLTNSTQDILIRNTVNRVIDKSTLVYKFKISKTGPLYIYNYSLNPSKVILNGNLINIPFYSQQDNKYYPEAWRNGLLFLGVFKAGDDVCIALVPKKNAAIVSIRNSVHFYSLDLEELQKTCERLQAEVDCSYKVKGNKLVLHLGNAAVGKDLFLPIRYSENWQARLNGKEVKPVSLYGGLLGIPLSVDGKCRIDLECYPRYYRLLLPWLIVLALTMFIYRKYGKWSLPSKWFHITNKVLTYVYFCLWVPAIVGVFVIPTIYNLYLSGSNIFTKLQTLL